MISLGIVTEEIPTQEHLATIEAILDQLGFSEVDIPWKIYPEMPSTDIVLCFGGALAKQLCHRDTKFGAWQGEGQYLENQGPYFLPTYSLEEALSGLAPLFDDIFEAIQRAVRLATEVIPMPYRNYKVDVRVFSNDTPKSEYDSIWNQFVSEGINEFALDTESVAPHDQPRPAEDDWFMWQICWGEVAWAFPTNEDSLELLTKLLQSGASVILHNCQYDLQVLQANGLPKPAGEVIDTMLLALCLTEKAERLSLKYISRVYLGANSYAEDLALAGYSHAVGPRNDAEFYAVGYYGGLDAWNTFWGKKILLKLVELADDYRLYSETLLPAALTFSQIQSQGALVDLEYASTLEAEWLPLIEDAEHSLQEYAASVGFPKDKKYVQGQTKPAPCTSCTGTCLYSGPQKTWRQQHLSQTGQDESCRTCMKRRYTLVPDELLNVRSPKQLQHLAFDCLDFPMFHGGRSVDKKFLERHAGTPLVEKLGQIRELDHLLRGYVRGISQHVWADGRVHPDFLLWGTVTGRLSIHNPPMQTLPKWGVNPKMSKMIRKMFIPQPGHVILESDYKNLELFIAWHYSGDEVLGRALTEHDFHRYTASEIFETPYDEVTGYQRFQSKFVTFGIAYGRQAYSLAQGELKEITGGDEALAQRYVDRFWMTYPDYARTYHGWQDEAIKEGLLTTPMGRKRRWNYVTPFNLQRIKNQAVNFPIQSLASDTCLHSLMQLAKLLPELGLGRVLFTVHDSIVFEIPEGRVREASDVIRRVMTTPIYPTHIQLFVDMEVGKSLGEVQDLEEYLRTQEQ